MLSSVRALTLLLVVAGAALRGTSSSLKSLAALTITIKTEIIQVCEFGHLHTHHPHLQYVITEAEREWVARKCIESCDVTSVDMSSDQTDCLHSCVAAGHRYILNEKIRKVKKEAVIVAYRRIQQLQIVAAHSVPDHSVPDHHANIARESKINSMNIAQEECQDQGDECVAEAYTRRRKQVKEADCESSEQAGTQATSDGNDSG
ncbi:hypothetical protein APHAL10511_008099 [Amanita phalloides]|nr:hypothetical protein APHAL10511_008099 [Amanita phalloides]